jgi:hypothetical protein
VRVWQNLQPFTAGTPVELVDRDGAQIGIQITIDGDVPSFSLHAGEYWAFALRPGFPDEIFPGRYQTDGQPPEGPRQWMAPLAWVSWNEKKPETKDCRPDFDDLVQLTKEIDELECEGCCTVRVKPNDAPKLQELIDAQKGKNGAVICFLPGVYELPGPLRLTHEHSYMTLEGDEGKVTLRAEPKAIDQFPQGLIEVTEARGITLRRLTLDIDELTLKADGQPPNERAPSADAGVDATSVLLGHFGDFGVGFGVRSVNSELIVERCSFVFAAPKKSRNMLGAGIFAGGDTILEVRECSFSGSAAAYSGITSLLGILVTPSVRATLRDRRALEGGGVLSAKLERAVIENNQFTKLRAAALVVGNFGRVHVEENEVTSSYAGFFMTVPDAWGGTRDYGKATGDELYALAMSEALDADRWLRLAVTLGEAYPLPDGADATKLVKLPPLAQGKTYEENATVEAAAFRSRIFEKVRAAQTSEKSAAAPPITVERGENIDYLTARDAPPLPVDVREASKTIDAVILNIGEYRPKFKELQVRGGSIHFSRNDVDLVTGTVASLFALAVFDPNSVVVVDANHFTNMYVFVPTVLLVAKRTVVNGNSVVNFASAGLAKEMQASVLEYGLQMQRDLEFEKVGADEFFRRTSLAVIPFGDDGISNTVIMGNLCEGRMLVPARPAANGPSWHELNTEVP